MNVIQVTNPLCPKSYLKDTQHVQGLWPFPPVPVVHAHLSQRDPLSLKRTTGTHKCIRLMPVCSSRGEARSGDGSQDSLWKSFGKTLENFGKKSSVENLLKQQIKNEEFYDEGSSGGNPPGNGGGGGDGFGGFEDEGLPGILDETIQVILGTLGFIFVYAYIINGEEISMLFKDVIKYLFRGKKSIRLTRILYQWERFSTNLTEKKEVDKYWLEKAIINTPTWWDDPENYRRIIRAYLQQQMQQTESRPDNNYSDDSDF